MFAWFTARTQIDVHETDALNQRPITDRSPEPRRPFGLGVLGLTEQAAAAIVLTQVLGLDV